MIVNFPNIFSPPPKQYKRAYDLTTKATTTVCCHKKRLLRTLTGESSCAAGRSKIFTTRTRLFPRTHDYEGKKLILFLILCLRNNFYSSEGSLLRHLQSLSITIQRLMHFLAFNIPTVSQPTTCKHVQRKSKCLYKTLCLPLNLRW